ncbi:DNA-3-methyladenine glycosylase [Nocardioides pacificus]
MTGSAELLDLLGRTAPEVAPALLGATLTHAGVTVRLTEVEAYGGVDDPGSHGDRGRTARNSVMFGPPGRLYVYFTYGMHHCANIVTDAEGVGSAVLLRAGEVVDGVDLARERRGTSSDRDLARGPARLCQALALDLGHNGAAVAPGGVELDLRPSDMGLDVSSGPRVGLRLAAERPWRYWLAGDPFVSVYRPASPSTRP